jgi:hypothetical protein
VTFNPTNGFWVLPTRRRPENLKRLFEAWEVTKSSTPGVLVVDLEDYAETRDQYLKLNLPQGWEFLISAKAELPGDKWRFVEGHKTYKQAAWVGSMSDDILPMTSCWDLKLLSKLDGKNYVSCNDNWQAHNGRITGGVVYSRQLLDLLGGFYPADFKHYFVDDLQEKIGRETGCWQTQMLIEVQHNHHLNGQAKLDDTHRRSSAVWEHDKEQWAKWLIYDYHNVKLNVLKLLGEEPRL